MTKHTPECPPLPNGSIDFNALNDACLAGKGHDAMVPDGTAMLVNEQAVTAVAEADALAVAAVKEIAEAAAAQKAATAPLAVKAKPPADAA
jgi:hypothetical protein